MKKKCCFCSKNVNVTTEYLCKCKSLFCFKHRFPDIHKCPIDYQQEGREFLTEKNPKVEHSKILKI